MRLNLPKNPSAETAMAVAADIAVNSPEHFNYVANSFDDEITALVKALVLSVSISGSLQLADLIDPLASLQIAVQNHFIDLINENADNKYPDDNEELNRNFISSEFME